MEKVNYVLPLKEIRLDSIRIAGGKNASLGELFNVLTPVGIQVPDGFAVTCNGYWNFIYDNQLKHPLVDLLKNLDRKEFTNLKDTGSKIRALMNTATLPAALAEKIKEAYKELCSRFGTDTDVAVRSSATAEDLPFASFAGQHESFLNIRGEKQLLDAVHRCYISLFTDRAIKYREDQGFNHMNVALSVGVQKMVRSDLASSGIAFTLEPESGFKDIVHISACWGLGENIVQGNVNPDEFFVFKPSLKSGKKAIVGKKVGTKGSTMIYGDKGAPGNGLTVINIETPLEKRQQFALSDAEVEQLARWCVAIEKHYQKPMDIEWAKDGISGQIYIVQARPETIHHREDSWRMKEYTLLKRGKVLVQGNAVGGKIAAGKARILNSSADSYKLNQGDVLVTDMTSPDWDPILKKCKAIITNKGGRTSHAAIVARELGVAAVVGTGHATENITDGQTVTVCCAEGKTGTVYDGLLDWQERELDFKNMILPKTKAMLITGDPEKAYKLSFYPNAGVGLMRLEFIISNAIQVHPMALVNFHLLKDVAAKQKIEELTHQYPDKTGYFTDRLSQAVATIACAFYPKEVIVRMSDFKTNEYAQLLGGLEFEPKEENPMIGFRGASRYYHEKYREGFRLECEAMKMVRNEMGFTNVKLMIPFCRTLEEAEKVIAEMAANRLKRGENGLEIYMMCEIPSNVIQAKDFAALFDGFSIGSNDLTQLTLGIDRDNALISNLFSEENAATQKMISSVIRSAKECGIKIGLCGQAPSDLPDFARFLIGEGIDSISFNADALIRGIENMNAAEEKINLMKV